MIASLAPASPDAAATSETPMLTRILLALYDTPASATARTLALDLAQHHKARVTALSVIDADRIAPPEAVPLGADSYKIHKDAVAIAAARERLKALAAQFAAACRAAHVACETAASEDDAIGALVAASDVHDLIVIGRDAAYAAARGGEPGEIAEHLLNRNPRPVLVASEHAPVGDNVLIAYDGSVPAMRALQIFCLMHFGVPGRTTVMTVNADAAAGERLAARAVEFLKAHGIAAASHVETADDDIAAALLEHAAAIGARLIVMGAYGHRGWREFILGSTTGELLAASKTPLFIYH